MPNYCCNRATITAVSEEAKEKYDKYMEYVLGIRDDKHSEFFNWFCPVPDGKSGTDFWGCKWDPGFEEGCSSFDKDNYVIHFGSETPWSPPTEFYDSLCSEGFDVEASYYEPGAGFIGSYNNMEDCCENIPSGDEDYNLLKVYFFLDSFDYTLRKEFDFESIKAGDIFSTVANETFIFVDMRKVNWEDFYEANSKIFDSQLPDWEEDICRIKEFEQDFYVIEFIEDASIPQTRKAIVTEGKPEIFSDVSETCR